MNKKFVLFIKIVVTVVIISLLYWMIKDNFAQLLLSLRSANLTYVLIAFVIFFINVLLATQRLGLIFSAQGIYINAKELIRLTFIGFFFNSFLPTGIGGDVIKGYYATKKFSHKKTEVYASVFADRLSGLIAMISISFVAMFIISGDVITHKLKLIITLVFALTVLFVILILNKKLVHKFRLLLPLLRKLKVENFVKKGYNVLNDFKSHRRTALFVILISLISQIILSTACFVLAKSLSIELSYFMFILFVPLTSMISMIPSIGGIGPREGAFIVLFSAFIGTVNTIVLALIWLAFYWMINCIGGFVYMFSSYQYKEIKKNYD